MPERNKRLLAEIERANALERRVIELIAEVTAARREERVRVVREILAGTEGGK